MPTSQIHCLGLNHRTAPVELRELFASPLIDLDSVLYGHAGGDKPESKGNGGDGGRAEGCPYHSKGRTSGDLVRERRSNGDRKARAWRAMLRRPDEGTFGQIREAAVFATCNRMELYARVDPPALDTEECLTEFLRVLYDVDSRRMAGHLYHHVGLSAVAHLCQVAAGLDSQILGETQIMGQITGAYENALDTLSAGPFLHSVFRAAIRAGKRSRTETTFSRNPASMSSVAIATAHEILGDLGDKSILVVGMGRMGMLALRALHARQLNNVTVVNRSPEKAAAVSEHWNFRALSLDRLSEAITQADVVISCTAAPGTLIDAETVQAVIDGRPARNLVIVDMAVPRDVDPRAANIPGVRLVDADELKVALDESLEARKREIPRVETIIAEEAAKCEIELRELAMRPVIAELRDKAESIRRGELEKTLRRLPDVDDNTVEHIHRMSRAIVNKILHEPTVRLKRIARTGLHNEYSSTVRDLFDLPGNGDS
jgi:glutamyl-tRNA reductase